MDRPDREKIAELEHEQWWYWAKSLVPELNDVLYKLPEGSLEADRLAARLARWASLFKPYAELTEEQKDQDREWADRLLALFDEEEIRKQERREVGEWLEKRSMKGEGSFAKIVLSQGDANVYRKDIEALKQGKLGEK